MKPVLNRPIEMCYWVVPGRLLAGEYPAVKDDPEATQQKIDDLIAGGVTTFVDLTQIPPDPLEPYEPFLEKHASAGIRRLSFPIRDADIPQSNEEMSEILDALDIAIGNQETVYVHCWGGIGRTGITVGCWLIRQGLGNQDALARQQELWKACPKSAWKSSPETPDQVKYVLEWGEQNIS